MHAYPTSMSSGPGAGSAGALSSSRSAAGSFLPLRASRLAASVCISSSSSSVKRGSDDSSRPVRRDSTGHADLSDHNTGDDDMTRSSQSVLRVGNQGRKGGCHALLHQPMGMDNVELGQSYRMQWHRPCVPGVVVEHAEQVGHVVGQGLVQGLDDVVPDALGEERGQQVEQPGHGTLVHPQVQPRDRHPPRRHAHHRLDRGWLAAGSWYLEKQASERSGLWRVSGVLNAELLLGVVGRTYLSSLDAEAEADAPVHHVRVRHAVTL